MNIIACSTKWAVRFSDDTVPQIALRVRTSFQRKPIVNLTIAHSSMSECYIVFQSESFTEKMTNNHYTIIMYSARKPRCLFESATPFRLEIVQMTSERVSHLGARVFAPVGRGTAGHPDRDWQRDEHTADRRPDRQARLHGQPRGQTQHVVPVQ